MKNDNSLFVAYEKNLKQFKDSVVKAGILAKDGSQNHGDGITVFQIGMIHDLLHILIGMHNLNNMSQML
jgi:hypothetical protein